MIELLFDAGMYWRIFYGTLRLVLGITLLKYVGTPAIDLFHQIMQHEFVEDPNDLLLTMIGQIVSTHGFSITFFLASYLIFWGVIDVFLSVSMLRHHIWAFPVSIVLIAAFVLYEAYRFSYTHSLMLLGVIIIDILVVWVIRKEYRKLAV